jgi:biotin synthase
MIPEKIRVSIGTASVLSLENARLKVPPTTAYLMTYTEEGCIANCAFCPQARESHGERDHLSRVMWPSYQTDKVVEALVEHDMETIQRVCIQVINYPNFFEDVVSLITNIKSRLDIPVSIDSPPLNREELERLREAGIEYISIPLDGATEKIFRRVKGEDAPGPYTWQRHLESLELAVKILGPSKVMSNLIIGLGETEEEALELIQRLADIDVETVLFAFTPIPGTRLAKIKQPEITNYRRIQAARYLLLNGYVEFDDISFDGNGELVDFGLENEELGRILYNGEAFETSGCPHCNRPYYNERPSGPQYNYPRPLTSEEVNNIIEEIGVEL